MVASESQPSEAAQNPDGVRPAAEAVSYDGTVCHRIAAKALPLFPLAIAMLELERVRSESERVRSESGPSS
jgi:hypothetical protein